MGLITRTDYLAGNDVTAEGQNANENAIVAEVNGNLQAVNFNATPALPGTFIADPPNGISGSKINLLTITRGNIINNELPLGKLDVTTYSHAADPANILTGTSIQVDTGLLVATTHVLLPYLTVTPGTGLNVTIVVYQAGGTWRLSIGVNGTLANLNLAANEIKVLYIDLT